MPASPRPAGRHGIVTKRTRPSRRASPARIARPRRSRVETTLIVTFSPARSPASAARPTASKGMNSWWNALVLMWIARSPDAPSSCRSRAAWGHRAQNPLVVTDDVNPRPAANSTTRRTSGMKRNGSPPLRPISRIEGMSRAPSIRRAISSNRTAPAWDGWESLQQCRQDILHLAVRSTPRTSGPVDVGGEWVMARLAENPGRYGDAEDAANPSHRRVYSPPQKEARPSYYQDSDLPTASRF